MGNKKYTINEQFFDKIDTEEKAYILGFFMADGCNYEDNGIVKLDLSECDKYMLQKMADIMEYNGTIKQYNKDTQKTFLGSEDKVYECQPMTRFLFRSKHISQVLASYGCISHKSEKGEFIKDGIVPSELYNHYIRGLIDGNGGLSYWEDNPLTHHKKFQINFCSTTNVVKELSKYLHNKFGCTATITDRWPDRDNNNLQFIICGNVQIERILDWLYNDSTIYLTRKYDKYLVLKEDRNRTNNDHNLYGNAFPRKAAINLSTLEIYETVTAAAKSNGVTTGTMTNWCRKHKGFMYLEEYNQINGTDLQYAV